jgi:hypothetical protein
MPTKKQKELLKVDNIALFKSQHVTFLSDGVNDKVFCLKNGPEIRTNSGTLIGEIFIKNNL